MMNHPYEASLRGPAHRRPATNRWLRALALASGIGVAAAPRSASAAHIYAQIEQGDVKGAAGGGAVQIDTVSLTAANGSNFVDHEFWYWNDWDNNLWVEVGFTDGEECLSDYPDADANNCEPWPGPYAHQQLFWADERPPGEGYHEHYPGFGLVLNNWYGVSVQSAGSGSWTVLANGYGYDPDTWAYLGTSTGNPAGAHIGMTAGIEATSAVSGQQVSGALQYWERENSSGQWQFGWGGPGEGGVSLYHDPPAQIGFVNSYTTLEAL